MERCLLDGIDENQPPGPSKKPSPGHTMIGPARLHNLGQVVQVVLDEQIPGDLMETGVWRGGASIYMRAILRVRGVKDRRVIVADSFEGLPPPNPERYPAESRERRTANEPAVSLEEVRSNFSHYGLLDDQVVFLKGWSRDTLPTAPVERLAVLRIGGDMYESTWDALVNLYDKVTPGGFIMIDDFADWDCARRAVMDFRAARAINDPMVPIDGVAAYWRKRSIGRSPRRRFRRPPLVPRVRVRGLLPKLMVARLRRARPPKATFLCIYRDAYLATTLEMVRAAEAARWDIRLWAVDEPSPELARHTVGHGPGARPVLLNRLADGVDANRWLVIRDDDTQFIYPWTVATFLTVCDRLGFDLAQPAQIWNSYLSFEFLSQGSVFARDTTFVEGGPIFAVSPRIRPKIVPFPETTEKGWGTDIAWSDYIAEGYRFGVVDAMPFEHLSPIGSAYDRGPELERTEAIMAERGLTYLTDVMQNLAIHRWLPFRGDRSVRIPP